MSTRRPKAPSASGSGLLVSAATRDVSEIQRTVRQLHEHTATLETANKNLLSEIIARKRAEEALRESEHTTRLIVENSLDAVIAMNSNGQITGWNAQAEVTFGWSRQEALGQTLDQVIIPERYREAHRRGLQRFSTTGEGPILNKRIEITALRRDGSEFPAELSVSPMKRAGTFFFSGFVRDLTVQKQVAGELRESERRFSDILRKVDLIAVMLDREAHITYCNDYLLRLTGWKREDVMGRDWFELFVPQDITDLKGVFSDLLADRPPTERLETEILTRSGDRRLIHWHNSALRTGDGQVIGMASLGKDITERKRAELELQRAAKRMQALARRLVGVQDAGQRRLSVDLHDGIGQNLTALSINLNLIGSMIPLELQPKLAERLRDSQGLLEKSIAFARDVIAELRPPALDDYGLLAGLRWYGAQVQARTGMATVVEGDEPLPRLRSPVEVALFRIAQEALTNTVKHAQARTASLRLHSNASKITLTIADDGAGFDLASFNQPGPHAHWGLMMMQERAEAVGAQLRMESAPGQGTRIVVEVARTA